MIHDVPAPPGLERRLVRALGTLDAGPGFEERLRARLAAQPPAATPADLGRARREAERERAATHGALARGLRRRIGLVVGTGLGALGPAWVLARGLADALGPDLGGGTGWLAAGSAALFVLWLGSTLGRATRDLAPGLLAR